METLLFSHIAYSSSQTQKANELYQLSHLQALKVKTSQKRENFNIFTEYAAETPSEKKTKCNQRLRQRTSHLFTEDMLRIQMVLVKS